MTTSIERLREKHIPWTDNRRKLCSACTFGAKTWPCDVITALDALEAENNRLREQVKHEALLAEIESLKQRILVLENQLMEDDRG